MKNKIGNYRMMLHSFKYPRVMGLALAASFGLMLGASDIAGVAAHDEIMIDGASRHSFKDKDTDGDGRLSREEFGADDPDSFDKLDLNSDGYVEREEIDEYVEMRVAEAMEALDAAMANFDADFDVEFDFSSDGDEYWDDEEFEEGMARLEERMGRMGERMARVGERVGRAAERAARQATRHIEREFRNKERHIEVRRRHGEQGNMQSMSEENMEEMIERRKDRVMSELDKDEDGQVSREEFPGSDRRFARMDENEDGFIARDELRVRIRIESGAPHIRREIIIKDDDEDEGDDNNNKFEPAREFEPQDKPRH